nr:MAG TPA: alpha-aminoadipate carrier protein [Caudoviricetes sp.]
MVRVIKYGQKRRVTCNHCGALLEFDNNDLETYQTDWNEWENVLNVQLALRL